MDDAALSELRERIADQKKLVRSLETDIENPRLLDSQIESLSAIAAELPARLDAEIATTRAKLESLITTRDARINYNQEKLAAAINRKANLKDQYSNAWDELQSLNQELKRGTHAGTLAKLKALREQSAALQATLPEHLRDISSAEDLLAIQQMIEETA